MEGRGPALYFPERHREVGIRLFGEIGLAVEGRIPGEKPGEGDRPKCGRSSVKTWALRDLSPALWNRRRPKVKGKLAELEARGTEASFLFLNLGDPATYDQTAAFEEMGFFFAGILPESPVGPALILQHLSSRVQLFYGEMHLVSPTGRELLAYVRERQMEAKNS